MDSNYLDAVIVTEGSDDVQILEALLTRWRHGNQGPWNPEIRIVPAKGEAGGQGNIPRLVKKYIELSDLIIVVFDPDDRPYPEVIEDIFEKISENLGEWRCLPEESIRLSVQRGFDIHRIRVIERTPRDKSEEARRALLAFWPAQIQSLDLAHSMLDYILMLLRQEKILEKVLEDLQQVRADEQIPARQIIEKHNEILKLLQAQKIKVSSSKRELDFLKALVGFREGYGKMGAKVIANKLVSEDDLKDVFGDMMRFIEELLAFVQSRE